MSTISIETMSANKKLLAQNQLNKARKVSSVYYTGDSKDDEILLQLGILKHNYITGSDVQVLFDNLNEKLNYDSAYTSERKPLYQALLIIISGSHNERFYYVDDALKILSFEKHSDLKEYVIYEANLALIENCIKKGRLAEAIVYSDRLYKKVTSDKNLNIFSDDVYQLKSLVEKLNSEKVKNLK